MAERKTFLVRLDPALHEALQRWADADLRSLNAQVEFVLRDALRRVGRLPTAPSTIFCRAAMIAVACCRRSIALAISGAYDR